VNVLAHTRMRRLFVAAGTLLLIVVVYVYFVRPTELERQNASQQLARKQQEYELLLSAGREAKDESLRMDYELARIKAMLPEAPYTESMLETMRMLETISGARMNGYMFALAEADSAESQLRKVTMTTSIQGTYSQVIRLLDEIQTSERILTVDKLEISVVGQDADTIQQHADDPQVVCHMTLAAYYAPELKNIYGAYERMVSTK